MNMFKSNGGFTLVELIVVIAILAILAGAAIPAYSGYIARANDSTVLAEMEAAETAAFAAAALLGTEPEKIVIGTDGKVTAYIADASDADADEDDDDDFDVLDIKEFWAADKVIKTANTKYEGKTTTWENGVWGEPVAPTPAA